MSFARRNYFRPPVVSHPEHGPDPRHNYPAVVYVLDADWGTKVGMCGGVDPYGRVKSIAATGGSTPAVVAWFKFETASEARRIEGLAHWLLADDRTVGEWFHTHPLVAVDAVRRAMRPETYAAYCERRVAA